MSDFWLSESTICHKKEKRTKLRKREIGREILMRENGKQRRVNKNQASIGSIDPKNRNKNRVKGLSVTLSSNKHLDPKRHL